MAVTVGISCLKNADSKNKAIVIFDWHERSDVDDEVVKSHKIELTNLLKALKNRKEECSFYIEFPHKAKKFTESSQLTINIPTKDAVEHEMKNGSIAYKAFDEREEANWWVNIMMESTHEIQASIDQNMPVPDEFKAVSFGAYLKSVQEQQSNAKKILGNLPAKLQETVVPRMDTFTKAQEMLLEKATKYGIKSSDHFFNLAKQVSSDASTKKKFYDTLLDMQCTESDMSLLQSISSGKNRLSIVHAGMWHGQNLEKALMAFGYKNAFPKENLKTGFIMEDISEIKLAKNIPLTFIKPVYEFLSLCDACGKEAANHCGACKRTKYCSQDCQKSGWIGHKAICKKL